MIERFLKQTKFTSQDDFIRNFHIEVPDNFNFAYDVMDVWAEENPDKLALLWTNDKGECIEFSFKDIKTLSDRTCPTPLSVCPSCAMLKPAPTRRWPTL